MQGKLKNKSIARHGKIALLLLPVLLLGLLAMTLGTTFAHYLTAKEATLAIEGAEETAVCFLAPDGKELGAWTRKEDDTNTYQLEFLLSNGTDAENVSQTEQSVSLRLLATASNDAEHTTVCLSADGQEYEGKPTTVTKGSMFWQRYGEGEVYRFYNAAGEELSWNLLGEKLSQVKMTLTVTGGAEGTAFTLMTARTTDTQEGGQ